MRDSTVFSPSYDGAVIILRGVNLNDRAQVVQDRLLDKRPEGMNRQLFLLLAVAAIFLPLGLITGLLGINLGGIPAFESPKRLLVRLCRACGADESSDLAVAKIGPVVSKQQQQHQMPQRKNTQEA